MARRRPAAGGAGGGEGIQAPRPIRARLATAFGAVGSAAVLAGYPAFEGVRPEWVVVALGAATVALLAAGLAMRWPFAVALALLTVGTEYLLLVTEHGSRLDQATPLYAGGFLATAELAYWSLEQRVPAWTDLELILRRLAHVLGACLAAMALAAVVLVAAAAGGGGGVALAAVGSAAAVGAVALVAVLVRESTLR